MVIESCVGHTKCNPAVEQNVLHMFANRSNNMFSALLPPGALSQQQGAGAWEPAVSLSSLLMAAAVHSILQSQITSRSSKHSSGGVMAVTGVRRPTADW